MAKVQTWTQTMLDRMGTAGRECCHDIASLAGEIDWLPETEGMVRAALWRHVPSQAALIDDEINAVLQQGEEMPRVLAEMLPRHGVSTAVGECPSPPVANQAVRDVWRQEAQRADAVRSLAADLSAGMADVALPGITTRLAVNNATLYGTGCIALCSACGIVGHVRRLAGALMAYLLFDHIGDALQGAVRRMVLAEMMKYWNDRKWSPRPVAKVRAALEPTTRRAWERARAWISFERGAGVADTDRIIGAVAKVIAAECGGQKADPDGTRDTIDGRRLGRSVHKNVAAVAFLMVAFADDPMADVTPTSMCLAGRAAAMTQLYDDLLDRTADAASDQQTGVTELTPGAYRKVAGGAARAITVLLEKATEASMLVGHVSKHVGAERLVRWSEGIGLLMELMLTRRNITMFSAAQTDRLERVCHDGVSPFDLGRGFCEWLAL